MEEDPINNLNMIITNNLAKVEEVLQKEYKNMIILEKMEAEAEEEEEVEATEGEEEAKEAEEEVEEICKELLQLLNKKVYNTIKILFYILKY